MTGIQGSDGGALGRPRLESLREEHWPGVLSVYREGIATGDATFETEPPDWTAWNAGHLGRPRLVALPRDVGEEELPDVLGWAALSPVSGRCVYGGVAEASVYVAERARGRRVGRSLLEGLVTRSEEEGLWTLQAGIFPENEASLRLFGGCGFRTVGRRERLGRHHGRWRDVLLLERRSNVVGV